MHLSVSMLKSIINPNISNRFQFVSSFILKKDCGYRLSHSIIKDASLFKQALQNKPLQQEILPTNEDELTMTRDIIGKVNDEIVNHSHGRLFAVIYVLGKQYLVKQEDLLVIREHYDSIVSDQFYPSNGDKIRMEKVLAVGGRDFTLLGRPLLPKDLVNVEATVVEKTLAATRIRIKYLSQRKPMHCKDAEPGREGGTWLGVSETGKIACLLNVFQSKSKYMNRKGASRGFLTVNYLTQSSNTSEDYRKKLKESEVVYDPFNLVLLELSEGKFEGVAFTNTDETSSLNINPGIVYGFGNCKLGNQFNKVTSGIEMMEKLVDVNGSKENEPALIESLFEMMRETKRHYPDDVLRNQGEGWSEGYIQGLSSVWVAIPEVKYGTRTTTIITVDASNELTYYERTMKTPSSSCEDFENTTFKLQLSN